VSAEIPQLEISLLLDSRTVTVVPLRRPNGHSARDLREQGVGEAVQGVSSQKRNNSETVLTHFASTSLEGLAEGRRSSADDLVADYGPLVWAIARNCTDCAASAEEAAVEIFTCLFRNASAFDPLEGSEEAFVRAAATRCILRRSLADRIRIR
jgi:hypothetical protein